jgi:hypothetical protein
VASWDDVERITADLPETKRRASDQGVREWRINGKLFTWERPLRRSDLEALGDDAPDGPILAAWLPDLGAKEALLAADPGVYFTTPHFDGYRAILVRLDAIAVAELDELIVEAWLDRAPKRVGSQYLADRG